MDHPAEHTVPVSTDMSDADQRNWAVWLHLSALSGLFTAGLGSVLLPLLLWQMKKDVSPFLDQHGREALNFNLTIFVTTTLLFGTGALLLIFLVGFVLWIFAAVLSILWLVLTVLAALAASRGQYYRYPLTLRLI